MPIRILVDKPRYQWSEYWAEEGCCGKDNHWPEISSERMLNLRSHVLVLEDIGDGPSRDR